MPVLKPRPRLVTFRLSNDEYEVLENACISTGSRSISDFARTAVLNRIKAQSTQEASLVDDLATLTKQLSELDGSLRELHFRIRRVLGAVTQEGDMGGDGPSRA